MDESFKFSFFRTSGLTPLERDVLVDAHDFFGLPYDPAGEGKIAGVLVLPDNRRFIFISGKHGGPSGGTQAGFVPRGGGSGINRFTVTHIEGHTAATLHRVAGETMASAEAGEAALLLPKPPCGACDPNLPMMLPRGSRLFVVDPRATTVYQSPSGLRITGPRFPRDADHFGGGGGRMRPGAGAVVIMGLEVMIDGISQQNQARDLREKLEKLQAEVRTKLPGLMMQAIEIQMEGHQPRVNMVISASKVIKKTPSHPLAPPKEEVTYEFRLESVTVSRETVEWGEEPEFGELGINPFKEEAKWRMARSFDWGLPEDQVDFYEEFKMRSMWFDQALSSRDVTSGELARLNMERQWNETMFRVASADWAEQVQKAPKPAFHPAPAPGVFLPNMPPPLLPPFVPPKPPAPPAPPVAKPAVPVKPPYNISKIAQKVYDAMGPGTGTMTYRQIAQRGGLAMDDVILGLEELNRTGKVVLVRVPGDVNRQQAFRSK